MRLLRRCLTPFPLSHKACCYLLFHTRPAVCVLVFLVCGFFAAYAQSLMGGLIINKSALNTCQHIWDRVDLRVSCPYHTFNIFCCQARALKALHNTKQRYLPHFHVRLESHLVIHALVPATVSTTVCYNAAECQHQGAPPDTGQLALEAAACPECCRGGVQGQGAA